ncbi:MAG TPA: outer membrane beta-barrel protein [Methyloceanibacter sp.]|nr:outer membrane beta-barrel protein [Methyloceanibacter sp.]
MGQTRSIILGVAALVMGQTVSAYAADLGLPPPPLEYPAPCVGCTGPVYLKGFIGAANPNVGSISTEDYQFNDFEVFHEDIKSTPFFGVGIGYEFNSWLRFDVTGEYRGKSLFIAQDRYPGGNGTFSRASNDIDGTFFPGTNEYTADIESWVGLANAYIDLGTYMCITPYVGGGIGMASVSVLGLKDVNVPNGGVAYGADHTQTNFAWAVYGGLAYDVNPSVTLDLSYRYTDLGSARSGTVTAYDNTSSYSGVDIDDIHSHDVMLGMRWKLGHQPAAPMPVAFK